MERIENNKPGHLVCTRCSQMIGGFIVVFHGVVMMKVLCINCMEQDECDLDESFEVAS